MWVFARSCTSAWDIMYISWKPSWLVSLINYWISKVELFASFACHTFYLDSITIFKKMFSVRFSPISFSIAIWIWNITLWMRSTNPNFFWKVYCQYLTAHSRIDQILSVQYRKETVLSAPTLDNMTSVFRQHSWVISCTWKITPLYSQISAAEQLKQLTESGNRTIIWCLN